jgi:hypothetical protein
MGRFRLPVCGLLAIVLSIFLFGTSLASADECERTSRMRIYSNASYIEEAGDVSGYELAVHRHDGNAIDAVLYFYQGAPNEDGMSISGQIVGRKLQMEGDWVEHFIESSSLKEIADTRHFKLTGTLTSAWFRGTLVFAGTPEKVKLKHVSRLWMCAASKDKP